MRRKGKVYSVNARCRLHPVVMQSDTAHSEHRTFNVKESGFSIAVLWICMFAVLVMTSCTPIEALPESGTVELDVPSEPMYVGSYARVPVSIGIPDVTFDDLLFRVAEGAHGGVVSESRDRTFDPQQPHTVLIAGYRPGSYTLEAVQIATNDVVGKTSFEVTVKSTGGNRGPSFVTQADGPEPAVGSAWGGGPSGLQNVGTNTTTGPQNIALIFADTDDQRYSTNAATLEAFRTRWQDHIIDGVTMPDGTERSVRRYVREASLNRANVTLQMFGPYQLDGSWDEVGPGAGLFAHAQAAMTAADNDINFNQFNSILVVSQSVGALGDTTAQFAWPRASLGRGGWWTTSNGNVTLGAMQMPNDWTERDGWPGTNGRQLYATTMHELGHNFGLPDLYIPEVSGRNIDQWDIMHADRRIPNFSLANRLRLGWTDENWIRGFNFATLGSDVDETISLRTPAAGAPGAGRFAGAEIRITDGLNYYFEFRNQSNTQIADLQLPANQRILGTDARSDSYEPPFERPAILLLPRFPGSTGAVLGEGDEYRETDNTSPIYPVEFVATASNINENGADLRIRYGVHDKPDPSIRPWGAPPWQTPDIEVRNERNAGNPEWFNVPWQGNPNTVVAKVKNNGLLDAPDVRVDFYVKNYNVGGAPESYLGSDIRDIAAGQRVEFTTNWVPPSDGHYCIVVRIPLYTRPGTPPVTEITELNNVAQSNYDRFISPTASPATRKITSVEVGNPYDLPTRVYIGVDQNNPYYRTYLDHRWLDLAPHETAQVGVMLEFVGSLPPVGVEERPTHKLELPNRVTLQSLIIDPYDGNGHVMHRLGGAELDVVTGMATRIEEFGYRNGGFGGVVITSDGEPVPSGTVILTIRPKDDQNQDFEITNARGRVSNGQFHIPIRQRDGTGQAYFLPPDGYGDATSSIVAIP